MIQGNCARTLTTFLGSCAVGKNILWGTVWLFAFCGTWSFVANMLEIQKKIIETIEFQKQNINAFKGIIKAQDEVIKHQHENIEIMKETLRSQKIMTDTAKTITKK